MLLFNSFSKECTEKKKARLLSEKSKRQIPSGLIISETPVLDRYKTIEVGIEGIICNSFLSLIITEVLSGEIHVPTEEEKQELALKSHPEVAFIYH